MFNACSPHVQQKMKSREESEQIVGREFIVMANNVESSNRSFSSHFYHRVTGLKNAELLLNDLVKKLESDGYRHIASTKNALNALLYKKQTAKFIFFNEVKNKQIDLWFSRVFPPSERYLKGVDLHIAVRILTSEQSSPDTSEVE